MPNLELDGGGTRLLEPKDFRLVPAVTDLLCTELHDLRAAPRRVASEVMNQSVVVAELDDTVVGAISFQTNTPLGHLDERMTHVSAIAVHHAHQGRGIGTLLMAHAARLSLDEGDIGMSVTSISYGGAGFFETIGFKKNDRLFLPKPRMGSLAAAAKITRPSTHSHA